MYIYRKKLEEIWKTEDMWDFLMEMNLYVSEKITTWDSYNQLTDAELTLSVCYELDLEINNGGFLQYYLNTEGYFCLIAPEMLRKVGANQMAEIVERANQAFPETLSEDPRVRAKQMDELLEMDDDFIERRMSELSKEYYHSDDNLGVLLHEFCFSHRDEFTKE